MLYVPFILTTNDTPSSLHTRIDRSFYERIQIIFFPHSILNLKKDIEKLEDAHHDHLHTSPPSWIKNKELTATMQQK